MIEATKMKLVANGRLNDNTIEEPKLRGAWPSAVRSRSQLFLKMLEENSQLFVRCSFGKNRLFLLFLRKRGRDAPS